MKVVSYCRICQAGCGLIVDVEDGQIRSVSGDRDHPTTQGFTCSKGRKIADFQYHPERLVSSLRRQNGAFVPTDVTQAVADVAARLGQLEEQYGPESIAIYWGTQALMAAPTLPVGRAWWNEIGSHKTFSTLTIDQVAKVIAAGRIGQHLGGTHRFEDSDVWLVAGANPLVSLAGGAPARGFPSMANPRERIKRAQERGLMLIVVDPRRTETAQLADVHLQLRPGTDWALFAAMCGVVLDEHLEDSTFLHKHTRNVREFRAAIRPFDPPRAAEICGLGASEIVDAARLFAMARRGTATGSTGTDMAKYCNTTEHLISALNIICGRYCREGDADYEVGALLSRPKPRDETVSPSEPWLAGWRSRFGFGLIPGFASGSRGELPATYLADEILEPDPTRVRALIVVGGNPAVAIPDQDRIVAALRSLDLLVTIDPWMSETARLAHYVIAPSLPLERADHTGSVLEMFGRPVPYAQYTPAVTVPPPGVIDDWKFFWMLAQAMGKSLDFSLFNFESVPTTDEILAHLAHDGRVALDDVKRHTHGIAVERSPEDVIGPPAPGADSGFLDLLPREWEKEWFDLLLTESRVGRSASALQLIVRREKDVYNSTGRTIDGLGAERTNVLYLHPNDYAAANCADDQLVTVVGEFGEIVARTKIDPTLRMGVVAMAHCWGGLSEDDHASNGVGQNTGRLVSTKADVAPVSNMPTMTGITVRLIAHRPGDPAVS